MAKHSSVGWESFLFRRFHMCIECFDWLLLAIDPLLKRHLTIITLGFLSSWLQIWLFYHGALHVLLFGPPPLSVSMYVYIFGDLHVFIEEEYIIFREGWRTKIPDKYKLTDCWILSCNNLILSLIVCVPFWCCIFV